MEWPEVEPASQKMRDFFEFTQTLDPARVIYNGLVPFTVSMFEFFFSRVFRILIAYDPYALKKRESHNARVDFTTLLQVSGGNRTIEDVVASSYSFQNIDQLNKAYVEWLNIDVRKLLYKKRCIGRKITFLENRIREIIEYRHGVVHHFELDRSLTKNGYIAILNAVEASITEFVCFLENKYNMKIDLV